MVKDDIKSLYDGLVGRGYSKGDIGDEETFRRKMSDKNSRRQLYDYVSGRGDFRIGDYETYERRLSGAVNDHSREEPVREEPEEHLTLRQMVEGRNGFHVPTRREAERQYGTSYSPYPDNGDIIRNVIGEGKLDKTIHAEEEKMLDRNFTPAPAESLDDIYGNYAARFSGTSRGKELGRELEGIRTEVSEKYAHEYLQSPEYGRLAQQFGGEELDRHANEEFERLYGERIGKEMLPYEEAYSKEIMNRYRDDIERESNELVKRETGNRLKELKGDVDRQLEGIHSRLRRRGGQSAAGALMGSTSYNRESEAERQALSELESAKRIIDGSQRIIDEAAKKGNTNFVAGLGRGIRDSFNADNWSFGLTELARNVNLDRVLDKADRNEALTESEQTLLDALVTDMAVNAYYSSDLGKGYKAGQTTGASIPFMLEFAVNPVSASGSAIAKSLLRYGARRFGLAAAQGAARRSALSGARLLGDAAAAAAMTGTTGAARVAGDTQERMRGDVNLDFDDRGRAQYAGRTNRMGTGEAFGRSLASNFLENQSEMIFNAFPGIGRRIAETVPGGMPGVLKRFGNTHMGQSVRQLYREMKDNPALREIARRMQFHGLGEEYMEEVYNNFASIPLGDMTLEDAVSLDNNIDTFLGLAPTSVAFAMLGLGGMARERYSNRRNMRRIFGRMTPEQRRMLDELQRMSKENGNGDIRRFIRETVENPDLTQEEKRDEIQYAWEMVKGNAIEDIQEEETQEKVAAENADIDAHSDPQTDTYTEMDRLVMNGTGEYVRVPGYKIGEIGGMPVWVSEGAEVTPESSVVLKPGEWDESTVRSMQTEEVKAENEAMIREEEAAQAEREGAYSPDIPPLQVGAVFTSGADTYEVIQRNPDGGWIANKTTAEENGKRKQSVVPVSEQEYMDMMQARIDAEDEAREQVRQGNGVNSLGKSPQNEISPSGGQSNVSEQPDGGVKEWYGNLRLSGESDQNSRPFVLSPDGSIDFGRITADRNLPEAPVRLSMGDKDNGYIHINIRHGKEIQGAGFSSIEEFVSYVVNNYTRIQKGSAYKNERGGENQTYLVQLQDGKNNTLFVQLSRDGSYWNVNSAGVFNKRFGNNKENIWSVPVQQSGNSAIASDGSQYEPTTEHGSSSTGNPSNISLNKDTEITPEKQGEGTENVIPTDEKGNLLYYRVPVDVTLQSIAEEGLEPEEVDAFIAANQTEADKNLKRIQDKAPKMGTSIAAYKKEKAEWQERVADAQWQSDYWRQIKEEVDNMRKSPGDKTAEEIAQMGEPLNGEEFAAMMLGNGNLPLLRESYVHELGAGNREVQGLFGLFSSKERGGMSIEEAGERLMEADRENGTNFFDQSDPNSGRNAIIEVLSKVRTRGDLTDYIRRNREAMAERERKAEYDAFSDWCEHEMHMTPEEYEAYQEYISENNPYEGVPVEELGRIFAEAEEEFQTYLNQQDNGQRPSENGSETDSGPSERNEPARETGGREAGVSVLPEAQPVLQGQVQGRTGRTETESLQTDDGVRAPEGIVSEGASGSEGIENQINNENNEINGFAVPNIEQGESILEYAERVAKNAEIRKARKEVEASPTDAQKKAGNYKKGHITLDGYDITIENPKGSTRSGVDASGQPWSVTMNNDYGYIRGTEGVDGDHIDVFLSDDPTTGKVYVIDQVKEDGSFDEHKVMYGFASSDEAREAYLANYSPGWKGLGTISEASKGEFKKWVDSSHRKTKPFAEYKSVKAEGTQNEEKQVTSRTLDDIKIERESIIRDIIADLKEEYDFANLHKTDEEIRKNAEELVDYNEESDLYMEVWDRLEIFVGAEGMDKLEADALKNGEDRLSLATMIDEIEHRENREQKEAEKIKEQSGSVEKIEDVGEKIGGAKKDRFKEFVEKEKQLQEKPDNFMEELRKLPVSKIFNFNLEALRKDGLSNEAATLIDVIRRVIPSKPRTDWKLKRWMSDVFGLYRFCLTLATAEQGTLDNVLDRVANIKQIGGMYRAQMALGGFDSGLDTGQATLEELGDSAGHYDKDGNWVSIKGQWYVSHAGRYGGIYPDHEKAKEALTKFAGENSRPKGKGTETKFSVYHFVKSGEAFITPKGKPSIVVESGFKSSKEALDYLNEHMDELQAKYRNMKDSTSVDFEANRRRKGKDWRGGRDISAEDFRNTFGFRGVEFGNWTNQAERQRVLNEAYDAFMDLSEATGISPKGLSLGGELGMAFGARGGGSAAAHYESGKVVINLTKTQGAGTLAHEWWHAIDNYFSRRRGQALGFNTDRKGYNLPVKGGKVEFGHEAERKEITRAFVSLMKAISDSSYGERSNAYANLKSSYWKEPTELGARAFAVWVERRLSEKGVVNDFLANNNTRGWESLELTQKYYPYPLESDFESLDTAFDNLFNVIEEKVDEETGNTILYREDELSWVNERFNKELSVLTEENASSVRLQLGRPSSILLSTGIPDKPLILYGNKLIKKAKKHGFSTKDIKDLPLAMQSPIAVFIGSHPNSFAVLLEMEINGKNVLVSIETEKGGEIDFNIISSVFGKNSKGVIKWMLDGKIRYVDKEKALSYISASAPIADATYKKELSDATNVVKNFENPKPVDENLREGNGALTDSELSNANDPMAKLAGKSTRTERQRREFAERERRRMAERVRELAEKLHLDNVDIVTDASALQGRRAKAKGFFNPATGRITVVIPNHSSVFDAEQTLLHEAVAHYGLRELFGGHFDTFLDNVFRNADIEVRRRIVELAKRNGWNTQLATEEYLASLAEETNFEDTNAGWWRKIKELFLRMLHKVGFEGFTGVTLSDNELRYILWRSYENLREPGRYRSILGAAEDIAMQNGLKVGNYAPAGVSVGQVAEDSNSAKSDRIRKLRDSRPVEITGEEYKGKYELNRDSAQKYVLDNLRGEYTIKDTDEKVNISKVGAKKVTSHSMGNEAHLKSIAAIPQLINNAIFIEEHSPYKEGAQYDSYRYYVTGLKINGEDYTVRMTIGVKNGKYYYDHYLTKMEKGNLIEIAQGFIPTEDAPNPSYANVKDKRLLSILQADSEENLLFRETPDGNASDDGSREAYNRAVTGNRFRAQEAYQDSMLALKRLQEVVERFSGKPIQSFENAYMAENQMSSKNTREKEVYGERFFKPMVEEVGNLMKKGASYGEIIDYMIAKHGLERNEVFAKRDADLHTERRFADRYAELEALKRHDAVSEEEYEERKDRFDAERGEYHQERLADNSEKDYSGLTALAEKHGAEADDFKAHAEETVADFEGRFDTSSLWNKVNAATKETLRKSYESGMMSRGAYDKVKGMFDNYIPLRGWNEETAEDVYEYLNSETSPVNSVLKSAKGRRSLADDPIAVIGNMAESAIHQGNRNLMKQNFLNMAVNHPTDAVTVREAWYVKDPETGDWKISFPDIQEGDSADMVADKVEEHERRMEELGERGEATKVKEGLNIDYRIGARQAREHIVDVKRNGKDYLVFVNGNPRAAQAVNGLTNPNVEENRWLAGISRFNRELAANFTNRNPAFVLSNMTRDLIFSVSAVSIKENKGYAKKFKNNIWRAMRVVARNLRGKGDPQNNADDALFEEFLANGGETGYTMMHSVDEYRKMIKRELNNISGKTDYFRQVRACAQFFSMMNRWAEDVSRFTTYMTSKEVGRPVTEAVNDAKEVTVNFNRRGAAAKTDGVFGWTSGLFRNLYLFFNAGIQSLSNFGRLAKKSPKSFVTAVAGFTAAGFIVPVLNRLAISMLGDGDDDYYGNLPEWVRRNNLCLYVPGTKGKFITVPLPIELRAFYGLGEMAYQETIGGEGSEGSDIVYKAVNQITELLPLNPLGNNGDIVSTIMPDAFGPIWQAHENKDFTGKPIYRKSAFNETMPEWTKAYDSTADWLVDLSEWTNEIAGGDKYKRGELPMSNWNPAIVEHLFESYFGGMAKTFNQTAKTLAGAVESVMKGEKSDRLQWYSTPVLNRFVNDAGDDRSSFSRINERYYRLYDLYEETEKNRKGYANEAARGNLEYLEKLNDLYRSDDFRVYTRFKSYKRIIDRIRRLEKRLPEASEKERENLRQKTAELKRKVVEEVENN